MLSLIPHSSLPAPHTLHHTHTHTHTHTLQHFFDGVCVGKLRKIALLPPATASPNHGVSDGAIVRAGETLGSNCKCFGENRVTVLSINGTRSRIDVLQAEGAPLPFGTTLDAVGAGPNLLTAGAVAIPPHDENIANVYEHSANTGFGLRDSDSVVNASDDSSSGRSGGRLPEGAVLAGYTNQASVSTILRSVDQGVNVLIWSFIELTGNISSDPIQGGPSAKDVRGVLTGLASRKQRVTHLVSIGGWGAPHPELNRTGAAWWAEFKIWNANFAQLVEDAGPSGQGIPWGGFDGVDLDTEGSDTRLSPENTFPTALIELAGTFAQAAKADGYVSSMVPPQSYLDCGFSHYDPEGSVTHAPSWKPAFTYQGWNTYAPLLAKYGEAYDLVIVQIYEGWSRGNEFVQGQHMHPTSYVEQLSRNCTGGWEIDFKGAFGMHRQTVKVKPSQLVIGLANGWQRKLPEKVLYIDGDDAGKAFAALGGVKGLRGFGYWDIFDDDPSIGLVPKLAKYLTAAPSSSGGLGGGVAGGAMRREAVFVTTDGHDGCNKTDPTCGTNAFTLAHLMRDAFNVTDAMGMDQGGSTTMWVDGQGTNGIVSQSGGDPRPIFSGLFLAAQV